MRSVFNRLGLLLLLVTLVACLVSALSLYALISGQSGYIGELRKLLDGLRSENERLRGEIKKLREENANLTREKQTLENLLNDFKKAVYDIEASEAVSFDPRIEIVSCKASLSSVSVTIKNVGERPLKTVYVFLITEGALDVFGNYVYCKAVYDLWMGEEATVTLSTPIGKPYKVIAVAPP